MQGWMAAKAHWPDASPVIEWIQHRDPLDAPFYEDDLRREMRRPINRIFRRLTRLAPGEGLPPGGLIFHLSRCGSTLLSSLLRASGSVVLSEPPVLDELLRPVQGGPCHPDQLASLVRAMLGESRGLLKLDSWHVLHRQVYEQAFPTTPRVFLYRHPARILASHEREPGLQMVFGFLRLAELEVPDGVPYPARNDYAARVLRILMEAALEGSWLLIHQEQLPSVAWRELAELFEKSPTNEQVQKMQALVAFDAKNPGQAWQESTADPAPHFQQLCLDYGLEELYRELESARLG
ncbi:MAG: hypothetical protein AB7S38_19060 [Vulcanimicrobiota bacterium]